MITVDQSPIGQTAARRCQHLFRNHAAHPRPFTPRFLSPRPKGCSRAISAPTTCAACAAPAGASAIRPSISNSSPPSASTANACQRFPAQSDFPRSALQREKPRRNPRDDRRRSARLVFRHPRESSKGSRLSIASASPICSSARNSPPSPAAKRSGSAFRANSRNGKPAKRSTSSTSPPSASIAKTSLKLLPIFHHLADKKNTLVIIEHNLDIIANADYRIDLGPDAGSEGGRIMAQGTPEDVARSKSSRTAKYLRTSLIQK